MVNALGLRSNGCLQRELSLFDLGRVRVRVSFCSAHIMSASFSDLVVFEFKPTQLALAGQPA
jgi:hypothetical protein